MEPHDAEITPKLAGLLAEYAVVAGEYHAAKARLDEIVKSIKVEATTTQLYAGAPFGKYRFVTDRLPKPLILRWQTGKRVDIRALREKEPEIAHQFEVDDHKWVLEYDRKRV